MQLKKPARDAQYSERLDELTEDPEMTEEAFEMPEQPRQHRNRVPELEAAPEQTMARRAANGQESVIDAHSTFDGRYETQHDLRVQGSISGEVVCRGTLTIEPEANVRAKIQSRDAAIHGRVEGDIVCTGRLLLAGTSNFSGTIKAATLAVEEGATVSGNVEVAVAQKGRDEAAPPPAVHPVAQIEEERQERRTAEAVGAAPARNGRQAPSFAFVPSDDRRPDRH